MLSVFAAVNKESVEVTVVFVAATVFTVAAIGCCRYRIVICVAAIPAIAISLLSLCCC